MKRSVGLAAALLLPALAALAALAVLAVLAVLAPKPVDASLSDDFLSIRIGARAAGMGTGYTAAAEDADAVYWNPAGLSYAGVTEVSLMHLVWIAGLNYEHAAFLMPFEDNVSAAGAGVDVLWTGSFDSTDGFDVPVSASNACITFSYSRKLASFFSAGASVKYVSYSFGASKAGAVAGDMGLLLRFGNEGISAGVIVRNVGTNLKYGTSVEKLPMSYRAGVSYDLDMGDVGALLTADAGAETGGSIATGFGVEIGFFGSVMLRAGLGGDGFTTGAGLSIGPVSVDYAAIPGNALGGVYYISTTIAFGEKAEEKEYDE